jgi:anti-sigma factor (TIGR02949 family)
MKKQCERVDGLVTPYVDGEISQADRDEIDRHLRACPPCRGRVRAEQAIHALMRDRRSALSSEVPAALRARCASAARLARAGFGNAVAWRARVIPFALAASLVLVVAGAFLYELTAHSTHVMAAELTADHLKCFRVINSVLGTRHDASTVESAMASRFDWQMQLPEHPERAGLALVGARPCLYAEGLVAHIMYSHHGNPVSIFMLPKSVRADEVVEVMGHHASIWSVGNRTFVLITREPRAEVDRMTSFVHATLR